MKKSNISLYIGLVLLIGLSLVVMGPFLLSITLGGAFAIALLPFKKKLSGFLHLGNTSCSILICALFTLFILAPMVFTTWSLVKQIQVNPNFEASIEKFEVKTVRALNDTARLFTENYDADAIKNYVHQGRIAFTDWIQNVATNFITELPDLLVHFVMIVLAMFLILTSYYHGIAKLRISKLFSTQTVIQIDAILAAACRDVFFSNIIAGLFQSFLVACGIAVFTEYNPFLAFVFTFVVSFIPVIGAAPVAAAAGIFQLVDRDYEAAVGLIILSLIVGVSDNIVRAMLMAHDKEDSTVMNLLASISGIYVWGLPGLFIGPLVVTLTIKVTPLFLHELGRTKVNANATGLVKP